MNILKEKHIADCSTPDEFKETLKKFGLPKFTTLDGINPTGPLDDIDAWGKYPETAGYDLYFKYDYNSFGFRDTELNSDVDICYYGCSYSFGEGVPVEARWTNIVDNNLEFTSNNFCIPGSSPEDMLHLFMSTINFVNMKKAVFLFPDYYRYRMPICFSENDIRFMSLHPNFKELSTELQYQQAGKIMYMLPMEFWYDRFRKTLQTICHIAKLKNIKLYFSTWYYPNAADITEITKFYNVVNLPVFRSDGRGRDAITKKMPGSGHPGINSHKNFAIEVSQILGTQLGI